MFLHPYNVSLKFVSMHSGDTGLLACVLGSQRYLLSKVVFVDFLLKQCTRETQIIWPLYLKVKLSRKRSPGGRSRKQLITVIQAKEAEKDRVLK